MKRHFSNRGEALAEVTAARVLAHRKGSVKTSFVTQAGPRSSVPFWSSQRKEVTHHPQRRQPRRKDDVTISL